MANFLIADDSKAIRSVLKEILMLDGHSVIAEASTGKETVAYFLKYFPDVLILDLNLPDQNGFLVLKEIFSKYPSAKVIIISASSEKSLIDRCLETGAAFFLVKPFEFRNLLDIITTLLAK